MTAVFDFVAEQYDETFTDTVLGRWYRTAVWNNLSEYFVTGDVVLELGCGTGEDAVWLGARGITVHATDISPTMLEMTRRKWNTRGVSGRIAVSQLDASAVAATSPPEGPTSAGLEVSTDIYDGVLANFGVLNCMEEWKPLAGGLAKVVRPGGIVVVVVMGPLCPWEWIWFLVKGQPMRAFRRLRGPQTASLKNGVQLQIRYPSPAAMRRSFSPWFVHRRTVGLGVILPPPYGKSLIERRKKWFQKLVPWDRWLGQIFPGTWLNDHYLMVLQRRRTTGVTSH